MRDNARPVFSLMFRCMRSICFKTLLWGVLWCLPGMAGAAQSYRIDISPALYGVLSIDDPGEVFSPGVVEVFRKHDGKRLLRVTSDELVVDEHEGKVLANIHEMPYGEQSVIQYVDVNFDGVPDLAIMDGQNSCYHGPSFQVYLADPHDPVRFTHSADFTQLAQDYCGMFGVDADHHQLQTMTKSGCCWHQFSTYDVVAGRPQPVRVVEESYTDGLLETVESVRQNGRMVRHSTVDYALDGVDEHPVFAFDLADRPGKVVLFQAGDDRLAYVLLRKTGEVTEADFSYPEARDLRRRPPRQAPFRYATQGTRRSLVFSTRTATYTIYQDTASGAAGIRVDQGNRHVDWRARSGSLKGELSAVERDGYANVVRSGVTP